jgi:hypothetical protein
MSAGGPRSVDETPGETGSGTELDLSAHIVRVHEPAVQAAVEWARTADPDGNRPIDDPVVRQRLAQIELGLAVSTLTPGVQGRVLSADMIIRNSSDLMDLVGPRGLAVHGEVTAVADGWIEYAHRFAQGTSIYGGTSEILRNLIAERFLELPRSLPRTLLLDCADARPGRRRRPIPGGHFVGCGGEQCRRCGYQLRPRPGGTGSNLAEHLRDAALAAIARPLTDDPAVRDSLIAMIETCLA